MFVYKNWGHCPLTHEQFPVKFSLSDAFSPCWNQFLLGANSGVPGGGLPERWFVFDVAQLLPLGNGSVGFIHLAKWVLSEC